MGAIAENRKPADLKFAHEALKSIYAERDQLSKNMLSDYIQANGADRSLGVGRAKNASTISHATATRNGSGSVALMDEVDWARSAFRKIVNSLPDPFPAHIRGRYQRNPEIAEKFLVIYPVLAPHKDKETITAAQQMLRKKDMLEHIYSPRMVPDGVAATDRVMRRQAIWERYGYTSEEWMNSKERKTWDWVNATLREHLRPAIEAWIAECGRQGLEIKKIP